VAELTTDFANFVENSLFPPFDYNSDTGKWRNVVLRCTREGRTMMVVTTFGGLPLKEVEGLVDHYQGIVTSLHWVKSDRLSYGPGSPNRVLCGSSFITERIGALQFAVLPFSPFPTNITVYQNILEHVAKAIALDQSTVFVDVGCGIGLACLFLSSRAKRCVGIDQDEHFIHGSKKNAEMNETRNAYFVHSDREHDCDQILLDLSNNMSTGERIVCFFDTMNSGPPVKTLKAVRNCEKVDTLVYCSESAYTFSYDCEQLLFESAEEVRGAPFTLKSVDLFPFSSYSQNAKSVAVFTRVFST
jgi:23S rRNA (uracil1939-C5)-methyltransferase